MALKLDGDLPTLVDLGPGWTIQLRAVSPLDGSDVANVNISAIGMMVEAVSGTPPPTVEFGPFLLVPGPTA